MYLGKSIANIWPGMSDPDSQQEPPPPPQPPRPVPATRRAPTTPQSQVEADEAYARQLYEEYNGTSTLGGHPRSVSRGNRQPALPKPKRETGLKPNELYDDREHSFIDGRVIRICASPNANASDR